MRTKQAQRILVFLLGVTVMVLVGLMASGCPRTDPTSPVPTATATPTPTP